MLGYRSYKYFNCLINLRSWRQTTQILPSDEEKDLLKETSTVIANAALASS